MKNCMRLFWLLVVALLILQGTALASCNSLFNVSTTTSYQAFSSMVLKDYIGIRNYSTSTVNVQLKAFGTEFANLAPGTSWESERLPGADNANDFMRKRSSGGSATVEFNTCDTLIEAQDGDGGDGE